MTDSSASARYNAEQMAKTVQSRIETNKTSQSSFENSDIKTIFSRDPNKRNSIFVGNLTWVSIMFVWLVFFFLEEGVNLWHCTKDGVLVIVCDSKVYLSFCYVRLSSYTTLVTLHPSFSIQAYKKLLTLYHMPNILFVLLLLFL